MKKLCHSVLLRFSAACFFCFFVAILLLVLFVQPADARLVDTDGQAVEQQISYSLDVKPVFAANCVGCHQPAINRGGYTMTDFASLVTPGDSSIDPIVAGKPDESHLFELISLHDVDGELAAEMPIDAQPLKQKEIDTIRTWIEQGAINDSVETGPLHDADHPPTYSRLPTISSLDFSPDGNLLAVSGFHEVLLLDVSHLSNFKTESDAESSIATQGKLVKRLIGISPRIQSLKFSPSGDRLVVAGGSPGLAGEVQVWDVESGELVLAKAVSHDTVFGVSWSPDGSKIAFGCTDTTLRVIDAVSGKQILFQGAHSDWLRDTVFSPSGKQLVSVGRDMSCKLIDVETDRFIDNITSITPGALKGGISSVAMHPSRDEIVIGGADGVPKVYRTNRITKRVIGDDANLVRALPKMEGRIQSVAISSDAKRILAGSSLNGTGSIQVYAYEFDPTVSDELKAILRKQPGQWSKEERSKVEAYNTADVKVIHSNKVETGGVYSVDFHPGNKLFAVGGSDGSVRIYETESGKLSEILNPIDIVTKMKIAMKQDSGLSHWRFPIGEETISRTGSTKPTVKVERLLVSPDEITLTSPADYVQLAVQAILEDGSSIDVTSEVSCIYDQNIVTINQSTLEAVGMGETDLEVTWHGASATVPVSVELPTLWQPDFIRDVNPVLSKLGCNAGTCHGSQDGKKGFKLSLRGYDPIYDLRAFTDDLASRRINIAAPESSLMLKKPAGLVPHEGGVLLEPDEKYYRIVRDWIANGAKLDLATPRVTGLEILPSEPVLSDAGFAQQMRVVATYADGRSRDVTREAFVEIGNLEVASASGSVVTALRRGETPVLARYEGAFTATTLTVMGSRDGFAWNDAESWGSIDDLIISKWQRMKIVPSDLCDDATYVRRIYLDLTGLPPSAEQVKTFVADSRSAQAKRDALVDQLIGNESFVEHWANKWADLFQVNRKYLGSEGAKAFRDWIRKQVNENRPYNDFAYEVLTASGSNRENPAASYFKIHRTPEEAMENTTHLFLATRFNCNKCHDHPFERWTQDQYYETAAYFAQIDRKSDPESKGKKIGGSAVEGAKPLYEIIGDLDKGEVKHDRTGAITQPAFPFECEHEVDEDSSRREQIAKWIVAADNPYFATSYVNRLWGYTMGVGLIEPLDDIRAGNPATNPELLEYLRKEFVDHNFDTRHILKLICKSRAYQLSIKTNPFNEDDEVNYSHALARRLPAEVLFDSIHQALGSQLKIPGVAAGTRAAALPDAGVRLPSGFLSTLGRPARESSCECERSSDLQLGGVLALVSGPDLARAVKDPGNNLPKLVAKFSKDDELVNQLFFDILNRPATKEEIALTLESFSTIRPDHQKLIAQRDARKVTVEKLRPELEKTRIAAIASAKAELDVAIKAIEPDLLKLEEKQRSQLAAAELALKMFSESGDHFAHWKEQQLKSIQWHPLWIHNFKSAAGRQYEVRPDRSILLNRDKEGADVYTLEASTDLAGITAVRLETLPDSSLPAMGPGFAPNGNFVLNFFKIEVAHPDRPAEWKGVKIVSAVADYEQDGFPIQNTFDDDRPRQGWAISGGAAKVHWATYRLELPVGFSNGTLIRITMPQKFDAQHQLGCFRISVSKSNVSGLSLPDSLVADLTKPEDQLADEIKMKFKEAFLKDSPELVKLNQKVAEVKTPIAVDPKILALREKLARFEKPVPPDSILEQLEKDVKESENQLANERLTAAQDLAWALINSPSFLFNR